MMQPLPRNERRQNGRTELKRCCSLVTGSRRHSERGVAGPERPTWRTHRPTRVCGVMGDRDRRPPRLCGMGDGPGRHPDSVMDQRRGGGQAESLPTGTVTPKTSSLEDKEQKRHVIPV